MKLRTPGRDSHYLHKYILEKQTLHKRYWRFLMLTRKMLFFTAGEKDMRKLCHSLRVKVKIQLLVENYAPGVSRN